MAQTIKKQSIFLSGLLCLLSLLAAGYFQQQISQQQTGYPLPPQPSSLATNKEYGVNIDLTLYDELALNQTLDELQAAHLFWLRQPFRWADIEAERGQFDWAAYDRVVEAAHRRGFRFIAVLQTSPTWARPAESSPQTPPLEASDFGWFARQLAQHYQTEITTYQIWHEPNLSTQWGDRHVSPADYVHLLKNAAIPIRAIHPQAKILAASLAPTTENGPLNLNEPDFLRGMYQAQASPWFDILGGQLYGFHLPVDPLTADPDLLNIHRVQLLRQVMVEHGDAAKPIWATAFGWHALPPDWEGQPPTWPSDTPAKQRNRTRAALDYARANWPWLGPMLAVRWDTIDLAKDDPARGFAINPELLPPFQTVARTKPFIATVGDYPATHQSGQYSPGWRTGQTLVDIPSPDDDSATSPPTLTIPFEGTRLDLKIQRGPYRGYLRVTIDDQPSDLLPLDKTGRSYVVLYDPLYQADTVTLAQHLSDGLHTAIIEAEGGWGQWAIAGWVVQREAETAQSENRRLISLIIALLSGGNLLWYSRSAWSRLRDSVLTAWQTLFRQYDRLSYGWQLALTGGLALALYLSPGFIALLLLPILGLAFLLRLETGLWVISASLSFFLIKKSLPVGTFFGLELLLALLTLATLARLLLPDSLPLTPSSLWWRIIWQRIKILFPLKSGDWAALALVALAGLATWRAKLPGVSLYEWRTVVVGAVLFYILLRIIPQVTALSAPTSTPRTPSALAQSLVEALILGATLHAGSALWQYFFAPEQTITAEGVRRAIGYVYGSPNNLSLFLERVLPLAAVSLWFAQTGHRRIVYALATLIIGSTLFLTFSKGTLLLAIPAIVIFLALVKGGKRAWLLAGVGLLILGLTLIPLAGTERFQSTFSLAPGNTAFFRVRLWQSAWQMLLEHPLTGLGLDNFLYEYRTRYILPSAWAEPNLSHPHNLLLDFSTRLGVGGIILLLWLQISFWRNAWRGYQRASQGQMQAICLGLMASMVAFLVHGLVDNAFFLVDLAYVFFFSLGVVGWLREG